MLRAKPQVAPPVFHDRKKVEEPQSCFVGEIGKGLPIVTNDALPGGKPNVSLFVLEDIAGDALWAMRSSDGCTFHKIRIADGEAQVFLKGRKRIGFTWALFRQVGFFLPLAGTENDG